MTRNRGAQPGNKNAYKHGFYSKQFKADERRRFDQVVFADLSGEIELVRVYLQRLMGTQSAWLKNLDPETQLSVVRAIVLGTDSINSTVRTQIILAQVTKESDKIKARLLELSAEEEEPLDNPVLEE